MEGAALFRTGSGSITVRDSIISSSSRLSSPSNDLVGVAFSGGKNNCFSRNISMHMEPNHRGIRRTSSESDLIRSSLSTGDKIHKTFSKLGSRTFAERIPEEEDSEAENDNAKALNDDRRSLVGSWSDFGFPIHELGFHGGIIGNGNSIGTIDRSKLNAYYEDQLKLNPSDSLLLRNYAKYLHEVERNLEKAEEYYGRAILASPGDGEVLSLYGNLIWETQRDESRAKIYFDQSVHASPDDCMVLGSYAHFVWESEEDEEEEVERECVGAVSGATMVGAC